MGVSTFGLTDFTSQNIALVKTTLNDQGNVAKRYMAWFAPHAQPTANMKVAVDPGFVWSGQGNIVQVGAFEQGTLTSLAATVIGLADTSRLSAGMLVTATLNPTHAVTSPLAPFSANTTILSVDSATQVTLDGNANASGSYLLTFSQLTGTITAPSANPRKDIVVVDADTGMVSVITGAEAGSPSLPTVTNGKIPICWFQLATSTTAITNSMINDIRPFPGLGGTVYFRNYFDTVGGS